MSLDLNHLQLSDEPVIKNVSENAGDVKVLSVSDFVKITSNLISNFGVATVSGEIQRISNRGHIYFTLKDDFSTVECIMWQNSVRTLDFVPQAGSQVVVTGSPNLWEKNSSFRLICSSMKLAGRGLIMERLIKLKEKLQREGVFDYHKRPIPDFVNTVGIITSDKGNVLHDMAVTMQRRNPGVNIMVYDAKVQGEDAPESLIRALKLANEEKIADVLIIGRGGGSFEDLLPFSDEALVRAVALSEIPIISAVGHEPDFSFSDYAADHRAPTPTAAAEFVTRITKDMLKDAVKSYFERMDNAVLDLMVFYRNKAQLVAGRLNAVNPETYVLNKNTQLHQLISRLDGSIRDELNQKERELSSFKQRIASFEPQSVIASLQTRIFTLVSRLNAASSKIMSDSYDRLHFDTRVSCFDKCMDNSLSALCDRLNSLVLRANDANLDKKFYEVSKCFYENLSRLKASDPLFILSNGYSVTYDSNDCIAKIENIKAGDTIRTRLKDGYILSAVKEVVKEN